jgi:hypothetical protein
MGLMSLRTLLVIDDEVDIVDIIKEFLDESNIPVLTAYNFD